MRMLALMIWLLAAALLGGMLRMSPEAEPAKRAAELTERRLMVIAPNYVPQLRETVAPPAIDNAKKVVFVAGCSRLGVFPRRDWAERVAAILTNASMPTADDRVAPAAFPSPPAERIMKSWRVQHIGPDAYYLQFDAWAIDELASRMTLQRELLKQLLSINAIPEAC